MLAIASELYDKLLNIYKTEHDKLTKAQKKRINVQNIPENLPCDLYLDEDEDDLPSMPPLKDDEKVKLEQEETIAERKKLNDCNGTRTHNHLVRKRTLIHLAKLAK